MHAHESSGKQTINSSTAKPLQRAPEIFNVRQAYILIFIVCTLLMGIAQLLPQGSSFHSFGALSIFMGCIASLSLVAFFYLVRSYERHLKELRATKIALMQSESMFRSLAEVVPVGIFKTDEDGNCVFLNPRYLDISSQTLPQSIGLGWRKPIHVDDLAKVTTGWRILMEHGTPFSAEYRIEKPDGSLTWVYAQAQRQTGAHGELSGYVCSTTDITPNKAAEKEIQQLAFYDSLTGLPNRRLLMDRLKQVMTAASRTAHGGALLFLDLDNFKILNDTAGHDKGDLLLKQVAQRMKGCVREGDTVARLGGDEFVAVLENLSTNAREAARQAESVGEKVLLNLSQPYLLNGLEHHSTPSIGITMFDRKHDSIDELMKRADMAMYQAKAAGRNTLRFFDPEMQAAIAARNTLEADMRCGLLEQQFILNYQPQVDAMGVVTGAEAFVRWKHPKLGLVSPSAFIPLAEETGLILPLGAWVLETACRQVAQWSKAPKTRDLTLAVKVSAQQFRQQDIVAQVLNVLNDTGVRAAKLKLELNESLLIADIEDIIAKTTALSEQGVGISLADLGTGYSSLSHLKRLSLDQLRIDQSFVRGLLTNSNDAAVTKSIFALAQSLDLRVSAEGVETQEQRDALAAHGCHVYQGYFFSQPLQVREFEQLLSD